MGRVAFDFRAMTAADAQVVAAWHYEDEYAFYDATADDDDLAELQDPREWGLRYFSADDTAGALVGFLVLKASEGIVEIGLGLRPDLTGKGLGLDFVLAGLEFATARNGHPSFELRVAVFNERAMTVYRRAGFEIVERYVHETNGGSHPFVRMVREPLSD